MDDAKAKKLIFDMLRMLQTYEVELTAYHQVFQRIEQWAKDNEKPFNARVSLIRISSDPRCEAEARALYACCARLLLSDTPQNLDAALAEMKNLIAHRQKQPSIDPDPTALNNSPVN